MPVMHIYAAKDTFSNQSKEDIAEKLTTTGLQAEKIPVNDFTKSTTWIYFHDMPENSVFQGGQVLDRKVVSLEINVLKDGLNDESKRQLHHDLTEIFRRHLGLSLEDRVPLYIFIRELEHIHWGVFGGVADLTALRNA